MEGQDRGGEGRGRYIVLMHEGRGRGGSNG